jgi:3-hydroxyisobutyrate dehydrogenase-like beta-hydroxyacid dehydrogenase
MLDTLQASGFHSPIYLMKGEQLAKRDLAPRFQLALAEKDQRLAQEAAADQGARMPLNETVRRLLREAIDAGHGEEDMCAVAELFFAWAKVKR